MSRKKWQIIMDLDDTLMPTNEKYIRASCSCCLIVVRALGHRSPYPVEITQMEWDIDRELSKTHGFKIDRFPLSWVKTYERLCEQLGIEPSPKTSAQLLHTAGRFRYGPFHAFPGVASVLRRLKRQGHGLHLVTVGDEALQRRKLLQTKLFALFDSVHVEERDKKAALQKILAEHAGPAVMIGDNKEKDILPANELNLVTIWIPSQSRSAKDDKIQPDFTVRSFCELSALIRQLEAALERKVKKKA